MLKYEKNYRDTKYKRNVLFKHITKCSEWNSKQKLDDEW